MADGSNDWIFDAVMNIFQSPTWEIPFNQFIDENCIYFDNADENSLAWTEIHQKFTSMVEELLEQHLNMLGITPEQFLEACDKGKNQGGVQKDVFKFLLAMEDFLTFKNLMIKRNNELELECLGALKDAGCLKEGGEANAIAEEMKKQEEEELALLLKSLEEYEELCVANCNIADAEINLAQNLAIQSEAIQQFHEDELSSLPPEQVHEEVNKMIKKADKLTQLAEDASADAEKHQREIEIATKTEEELKKEKAKQAKADNIAEQQKMKEEAARLQQMAQNIEKKLTAPSSKPKQDPKAIAKMEQEVNNMRQKINDMHKIRETLGKSKEAAEDPLMAKALEERKKYLLEQRKKILEKKKEERTQKLEKFKKERDELVEEELKKPIPKSAASGTKAISDEERRRIAMRQTLCRKLKQDLLSDEKSSLPQLAQINEMEDQLAKAQELREQKKRKEKEAERHLAEQAKQRAKKAQQSLAGAEDW